MFFANHCCVPKMNNYSVLIFTAPLTLSRSSISKCFDLISGKICKNLLVYFNPLDVVSSFKPVFIEDRANLRNIIRKVYTVAASQLDCSIKVNCLIHNYVFPNSSVPVVPKISASCQSIFTDFEFYSTDLRLQRFCRETFNYNNPNGIERVCFDVILNENEETKSSESDLINLNMHFSSGVLGGTFDKLHYGHKILLTEAALLCQKRLFNGVTEKEMNAHKVLPEMIEPYDNRVRNIMNFMSTICPRVVMSCHPLFDIFGPSTTEPELECIISSFETVSGAYEVNKKRIADGMTELKIHVVEKLAVNSAKISSSDIRKALLGHLVKSPAKPQMFGEPYLIGLTGRSGSGKTSICKLLKSYGVGIINCDELAHKTYLPGCPAYFKLIEHFGSRIISENELIDRKILGKLVFDDPSEMAVLNGIVWPELLNLLQGRVALLKNEFNVIVIDAAVLIEAGLTEVVNEIWVTLLSIEEAAKRVSERVKITIEDALNRQKQQLSNEAYLKYANVIFCTLWSVEETKRQVDLAWAQLCKRARIYLS